MHNWLDDWFLSLSENPDKLDTFIRRFERGRTINLIGLVVILAVLLFLVFMPQKGPGDYDLIWSIFLFIMILNVFNILMIISSWPIIFFRCFKSFNQCYCLFIKLLNFKFF